MQTGLLATEPTNVGFFHLRATPESELMNHTNHKAFYIHLVNNKDLSSN